MKKIQSIPIVLIVLLSVFSMLVFFYSCTESKTRTVTYSGKASRVISQEEQEIVENNRNDSEFVKETAELNLAEIKLGQLAQQKSRNREVIELANAMETEHSVALQELQELAARKHIALKMTLDEEMQKKYEELSARPGDDFDREYTKTLVKRHKNAIMLFEKKIRETRDLEINNWIDKTLPALRKQLEHSEMCEKKCA